MPSAIKGTEWSAGFETSRREQLFRTPPKDRSAYPALAEAFAPHVGSFNALFEPNGLLESAIRDIGTKTFLDGNAEDSPDLRNKLSVRITNYFLHNPELPPSNKFSTRNRRIYPAECRERHSTYRGKFTVRLIVRLNDGVQRELVRDLGSLPIMLGVRFQYLSYATLET